MNLLAPILEDIRLMAVPALFNLYFAALAIPFGFVLAIILVLGKASRNPLLSGVSRLYIYAFRGSPFFIQLFAVYAVALSLNLSVWKPLGLDGFILHPLFLGPLVLGLNTAAYAAEIFHGAWRAIPQGEIDAARAFGFSPATRFRRIIWPALIRLAWPAYGNEIVFAVQATALIYFTLPVITGQRDIMSTASDLYARDFNVFLHFGVAALYFLVISFALFQLLGMIGRRLNRHLPAPPRQRAFRLLVTR